MNTAYEYSQRHEPFVIVVFRVDCGLPTNIQYETRARMGILLHYQADTQASNEPLWLVTPRTAKYTGLVRPYTGLSLQLQTLQTVSCVIHI